MIPSWQGVSKELREHYEDSSVVVCGASYGIGAEIALALCERAHVKNILLTARSEDKLEKVARQCRELGGGNVIVHAADLGTREGSASVIARAEREFGGIDTLILNHIISTYSDWAGRLIHDHESGSDAEGRNTAVEGSLDFVEQMFSINTLSYIYLSTYALPLLKQSEKAKIVVVGSLAGKLGLPRVAPYSATKFAAQGYFESLRQDLLASKDPQMRKIQITVAVLGSFNTKNARESAAVTMKNDAAVVWHPPALAANDLLVAGGRNHQTVYTPWSQTRLIILINGLFPELAGFLTRSIIVASEKGD